MIDTAWKEWKARNPGAFHANGDVWTAPPGERDGGPSSRCHTASCCPNKLSRPRRSSHLPIPPIQGTILWCARSSRRGAPAWSSCPGREICTKACGPTSRHPSTGQRSGPGSARRQCLRFSKGSGRACTRHEPSYTPCTSTAGPARASILRARSTATVCPNGARRECAKTRGTTRGSNPPLESLNLPEPACLQCKQAVA